MGCCISAPYRSIEIFVHQNSHSAKFGSDDCNGSYVYYNDCRYNNQLLDYKPIADVITIELQLKQNPDNEPFLINLSNWLANCSANELKITSYIENKCIETMLESFRFFRLQKLSITCLTKDSTEYLKSCVEVFREKYPDLQIQAYFLDHPYISNRHVPPGGE